MQAMPDARQQSFEEIYGPPENFLEIEVGFSFSTIPTPSPASLRFTSLTHAPSLPTQPTGQKPADPRLLPTHHVHELRDPYPHQHPRLQAAHLHRAPPLLGL
jgi:hypothetical protein